MTDNPPPQQTVTQQITAAVLGSRWAKVFGVLLALFAFAEAGLTFYNSYLEMLKRRAELPAVTGSMDMVRSPLQEVRYKDDFTKYADPVERLKIIEYFDRMEELLSDPSIKDYSKRSRYNNGGAPYGYGPQQLQTFRALYNVNTVADSKKLRTVYGIGADEHAP